MKYSHCTTEDLQAALDRVNEKYGGNITFNRLDKKGFTLKVKDSHGPGHRLHIRPDFSNGLLNVSRMLTRRSPYACWHVHGDFFDALFEVKPDAVVYSRGNRITKDRGNWEDFNIGSRMYPVYFSDSCECV